MSKNHKKLYAGAFIVAIFPVAIFSFSHLKEKKDINENVIQKSATISPKTDSKQKIQTSNSAPSPAFTQSANKNTESATVIAGQTTTHLSFPSNTLFYDALKQERSAGKIEFSGKNYPGLGFFITDIGTLHSGNGDYLLYYINGKEATVGVSSYTLKNGDIIEWKLE